MVDLPLLLRDMMSPSQQAVTISERVKITETIQDARVVAASPSAASWYGLASLEQLVGQWLSRVQHPDDVQLSRLLSTARHRGHPVPRAYVCRAKQPDGSYQLVTKQVQQLEVGAQIYWVTVLSAADGPPLRRADLQAQIGIPDDDITHTVGTMTVMDLEALLGQGPPPAMTSLLLALPPGGSMELPLGVDNYRRWIHHCHRCRKRWVAETASPRTCTHCSNFSWREAHKRPRRPRQRL